MSQNVSASQPQSARRQGIYWIATIPYEGTWTVGCGDDAPSFPFDLPSTCAYAKGQLECGGTTSYLHWQVIFIWSRKVSLRQLKESFSTSGHYELSRSSSAEDYVWKEDTRIEGSQFEIGARPIRRNSQQDWDQVWDAARSGRILDIPAQIRGKIKNLIFSLSL